MLLSFESEFLMRKKMEFTKVHFPKLKVVKKCFEWNKIVKIWKNGLLSNTTGVTMTLNIPAGVNNISDHIQYKLWKRKNTYMHNQLTKNQRTEKEYFRCLSNSFSWRAVAIHFSNAL